MGDVTPFPKSAQLARGPKRYRRKVATPKQWQAIQAAKCRECRVCSANPIHNGVTIDPHHLVPRSAPHFGDDLRENIVGLCRPCHEGVTLREPAHCRLMLTRLSDAEYTYAISRAGEDFAERVYGIEYDRRGE